MNDDTVISLRCRFDGVRGFDAEKRIHGRKRLRHS
jgi:hypothetical protein